jgi:hypothetical protein
MCLDRPAAGRLVMRLVLRRFVTPRSGRIEVALWSRSRAQAIDRPEVRRCVRLYALARARSRERQAAAE